MRLRCPTCGQLCESDGDIQPGDACPFCESQLMTSVKPIVASLAPRRRSSLIVFSIAFGIPLLMLACLYVVAMRVNANRQIAVSAPSVQPTTAKTNQPRVATKKPGTDFPIPYLPSGFSTSPGRRNTAIAFLVPPEITAEQLRWWDKEIRTTMGKEFPDMSTLYCANNDKKTILAGRAGDHAEFVWTGAIENQVRAYTIRSRRHRDERLLFIVDVPESATREHISAWDDEIRRNEHNWDIISTEFVSAAGSGLIAARASRNDSLDWKAQ